MYIVNENEMKPKSKVEENEIKLKLISDHFNKTGSGKKNYFS